MSTTIDGIGSQGQEPINAFDAVAPVIYILAKNSSRIKEVQLNGDYSPSQAREKLDRWTQEKRIVLVFQVGSECLALIHNMHAQRFHGVTPEIEPLSNRNILIRTLDGEEYDAATKKHIKDLCEDIEEFSLETEHARDVTPAPLETPVKERKGITSSAISVIASSSWKDILLRPHQIVKKILDTFSESVREEAELAKEQQKYDAIIANEIRKQALKHEIEQHDIKHS